MRETRGSKGQADDADAVERSKVEVLERRMDALTDKVDRVLQILERIDKGG